MNLKILTLENNNNFNNLIKYFKLKGKLFMSKKVVIVGSGNAALSAGIAALEKGAEVTIYEKAEDKMAGGNTK